MEFLIPVPKLVNGLSYSRSQSPVPAHVLCFVSSGGGWIKGVGEMGKYTDLKLLINSAITTPFPNSDSGGDLIESDDVTFATLLAYSLVWVLIDAEFQISMIEVCNLVGRLTTLLLVKYIHILQGII